MYIQDCIGEAYGGNQARDTRQTLIHSEKNIRKGILQKIDKDPRVTKVGNFLRKTSLDELASLRNVLKGDMSLVGPRPHMPHEVAQYETRHKRLFTIHPGIT
jgi:lipopolysaccharide/colanic/teichoic acid biosynthesis glycosyltransferase